MRKTTSTSFAVLLCLSSANSYASDDQRFIGVECLPERGVLRISYHSDHLGQFEEGYLVDTFSLKKNDPSGEFVQSIRTVVKKCTIKQVHYLVRVRAVPGAGRLNAECGGLTFGAVAVHRNGKKIADIQFEDCTDQPITTAVTFEQGSRVPALTIRGKF